MTDEIIIIGAGQAAAQAVQSLRAEGFEAPIRLFGDEPYAPYQRPPLSKKFLAGEIGYDRVELKAEDFYAQSGVATHWSTRVTEIDRRRKRVLTGDGQEFAYGKLLLATGSRVREINVPGFDLDGVHYLRNIDDVKSIQAHFRPGAKMVVVGGGYIGLEVAAVAVKRGIEVTVLETADRVMARVVDPIVSHFYERVHREEGVKIETRVTVAGFEGGTKVEAVVSGEGGRYPCDVVVVGIGILPNTELAAEAGLHVENGISVDEFCRTSDPDICAAGDCTSHPNGIYGTRLHRTGKDRGRNAGRQGKALRPSAVVLVGPVRPQAADHGAFQRLHASGGARRPDDGAQLRGVLSERRRADRGRCDQPRARIHDGENADGETRGARPGTHRRRGHRGQGDRRLSRRGGTGRETARQQATTRASGGARRMAKITYIEHDGKEHTLDVADGTTLMEAAVKASVPGIDGDCGGACACATCMVFVPEEWWDKIPPKEDMEETMLEFAENAEANSRLSCQIKAAPAIDGMRVSMPKSQH